MTARAPSAAPTLAGFRYVDLLGMGGFADVFHYEQLGLGRKVAVKVLLRGLGQGAQQSFEAEANVMAQLSNHPSIVSIYQAGAAEDGRAYLVMEYCPPPHLAVRIKSKPLTVPKALEVGIQIAGAVETAHRLGILHRDIKPGNILFTEYGRPALTDFGISATLGDPQASGLGMSVPWAPPEQLTGGRMGPASDVYSLAATIWTTLTGHSPFEVAGGPNDNYAMSRRVRNDPVPRTGRGDVSESLERVLRTAMSKQANLRYPSALEFARTLQGIQGELHHSISPLDVREEAVHDDFFEESSDTGTRISSFVVIDPDGDQANTGTGTGTSGAPNLLGATGSGTGRTAGGTGPGSVTQDRFTNQTGPSTLTSQALGVTGSTQAAHYSAQSAGTSRGPGVLQHGRGVAEPGLVEFSALPLPSLPTAQAVETPPVVATPEAKNRSKWPLLAVAVVALIVAAVLVGKTLLNQTPTAIRVTTPTASAKPADPLGAQVPAPTAVTVVKKGSTITVSWKNPAPQPGDKYAYRVPDPANPDAPDHLTTATSVELVPLVGSRTCPRVRLIRSNGNASDWAQGECTNG